MHGLVAVTSHESHVPIPLDYRRLLDGMATADPTKLGSHTLRQPEPNTLLKPQQPQLLLQRDPPHVPCTQPDSTPGPLHQPQHLLVGVHRVSRLRSKARVTTDRLKVGTYRVTRKEPKRRHYQLLVEEYARRPVCVRGRRCYQDQLFLLR